MATLFQRTFLIASTDERWNFVSVTAALLHNFVNDETTGCRAASSHVTMVDLLACPVKIFLFLDVTKLSWLYYSTINII